MKWLAAMTGAGLVMLSSGAFAAPGDPVEAAREEGLPTQLLEAKRREAQLKHVPGAQAEAVLQRLLTDLREATTVIPALPDAAAHDRLVSAAAQALSAGSSKDGVREVLQVAGSDAHLQEAALRALVSLQTAQVAPQAAVRLVESALAGGLGERLGAVRAALETLRRSGYGDGESVALLARSMSEGRPPLDVVDERVRRTEVAETAKREGSGPTASTSSTSSGAAPDRDHGTRDDVGAKGSASDDSGSQGGQGRGNQGGNGRGGKP